MRQIKFRAWDGHKMYSPAIVDGKDCHLLEDCEIKGYQLMQYTGLKDKNGKEIYEGDIVKSISGILVYAFWDAERCGFLYKNNSGFMAVFSGGENVEVIGNIYEHGDLLNQRTAKEGFEKLVHAIAENVSQDPESAEEYLKSEGIDVSKVKADAEWLAWKAELMSITSKHTGEWPQINDAAAREWYDSGASPQQCFRETWDSDGD